MRILALFVTIIGHTPQPRNNQLVPKAVRVTGLYGAGGLTKPIDTCVSTGPSFPLVGSNCVSLADVDVLPGNGEMAPGFRRRDLSGIGENESFWIGVNQ